MISLIFNFKLWHYSGTIVIFVKFEYVNIIFIVFLLDAHAIGINTQKELCSIAYKELNLLYS